MLSDEVRSSILRIFPESLVIHHNRRKSRESEGEIDRSDQSLEGVGGVTTTLVLTAGEGGDEVLSSLCEALTKITL